MKPDYQLQKAAERQEIIEKAVKAGMRSAQPRGKHHVEMNAEELGMLVDRLERFDELLLSAEVYLTVEDLEGRPKQLALVNEIKNARAGR